MDPMLVGIKGLLLIGGIISLFLGVAYIFIPGLIRGLNNLLSRAFEVDGWTFQNRLLVGIIFLIAAVILLGAYWSIINVQ